MCECVSMCVNVFIATCVFTFKSIVHSDACLVPFFSLPLHYNSSLTFLSLSDWQCEGCIKNALHLVLKCESSLFTILQQDTLSKHAEGFNRTKHSVVTRHLYFPVLSTVKYNTTNNMKKVCCKMMSHITSYNTQWKSINQLSLSLLLWSTVNSFLFLFLPRYHYRYNHCILILFCTSYAQ